MNDSSPIRRGEALALFERIDGTMRQWALAAGSEEQRYPALIDSATLQRAEYAEAFPHLLMAPAVAIDAEQPFTIRNSALAPWFLSPAICYHAYASLAGETLHEGRLLTARGCCFRHEDPAALAPGRRQVEFEMREVILVGASVWLEQQLIALQAGVDGLASQLGVTGASWQPASDPFFLPRARGKAHMQRLLGTKIELCLPDGLAVASINRHGTFFGERFSISTSDGAPASSACVAFGLDRWAAHSTSSPV